MVQFDDTPYSEKGLDMDSNKLVSIIIPVYNVRPYLAEALDSVVNQTYENLEIIIIDDGSTDGSSKVCDEYANNDSRIRLVHQENRGLSAARNLGLDIMNGDVVAFIDPDDKYLPTFVDKMLLTMDRDNVDMTICKHTVLRTIGEMRLVGNERIRPSIPNDVYDRVDALLAYAEGSINANVWNKIYKREVWGNIRFPVGHVYEDIATCHELINVCQRVSVLNDVLYIRRARPDSITSILSAQNRYDFVLSISKFEEFIERNTPVIFNKEHLKSVRKSKLYQMVVCYVLCYGKDNLENIDIKDLRHQILAIGRDVGVEGVLYIKLAYFLIQFCPIALPSIRSVYSLYRTMRSIIPKAPHWNRTVT